MSTQHTPGPWHVSKASPTRVIESGPRGNSIAKMGLNLGACSQGEAEANARLIAAAPDLLDALTDLLKAIEWSETKPVHNLTTLGRAMAKAKTAIAKVGAA